MINWLIYPSSEFLNVCFETQISPFENQQTQTFTPAGLFTKSFSKEGNSMTADHYHSHGSENSVGYKELNKTS